MLFYVLRPILVVLVRLVVWLCGGQRVEGACNVPRTGAVIITPNHVSFADPPVIGAAIRRPVWFMATDELFGMGFLGKLARVMRAFPVRQDSPDRAALKRTIALLKKGDGVVVFPEGHVSYTGDMQPIQPGTILLAIQSGAPIVPVGLVGTDRMMPHHKWNLRRMRRPLTIRFGDPIPVEALTGGLKGRAGIDHGVAVLQRAIAMLAEQPAPVNARPGQENEHAGSSALANGCDCRV